jgi:hypothetical protein
MPPPPRSSQAAGPLWVAAITCSRVIPTASSPRAMALQSMGVQSARARPTTWSCSAARRACSSAPWLRARAMSSSCVERTMAPLG